MVRNSSAIIIQTPQKIEKNVYEKEKEYGLLCGCYKIAAGQFFPEHQLKKTKGSENNYQYQECVKKIPNAKGYPAKKKPLHFSDQGINSVGIIILYPIRIPRSPFDKNGQKDKQNPTPAFHEPVK